MKAASPIYIVWDRNSNICSDMYTHVYEMSVWQLDAAVLCQLFYFYQTEKQNAPIEYVIIFITW